MSNEIINGNPIGGDSIKGGIFFGSALTPSGLFSNVPRFYEVAETQDKEATLMLTLQKVKDSLKSQLVAETGDSISDDTSLDKFLYDFTSLLIDYRDMRNYIFYGSANTEIAYNIKSLIETYPYSTLIGQKAGNTFIRLRNVINGATEYTEILFPDKFYYDATHSERVILDNFNRFNFYDDDGTFNWGNYEVLDKNGRRYKILKVVTPYRSPDIFNVTSIANAPSTVGISHTAIVITTDSPHNYLVGQQLQMTGMLCSDHTKALQFKIDLYDGTTLNYYPYQVNGEVFVVSAVTQNTVELVRLNGNSNEDLILVNSYDSTNTGIVRKYPLKVNAGPYTIKVTVAGSLTTDALMNFDFNAAGYTGLMIVPRQAIINDWTIALTDVQNQLLSPAPINPTPWPRRPVTNNIMNILDTSEIEQPFMEWIQGPSMMFQSKSIMDDDLSYDFSVYQEYRLARAFTLDDTETNQLIRRCIPHDLISELNDTDDFYFQRFIIIAGWFFDQIRLYVKFVKYAHTIDTSDFNQLSPDYYRHYASHYGLDLFSNDDIDFTKLVIKTEPGFYYFQNTIDANSKYYRYTLQKLQYERQKRLLLSLFYLYKVKGTQGCIQKLISLLGAPDGFLAVNEFVFSISDKDEVGYPTKGYAGTKKTDNDKIHTPNTRFEIDPDYLVDKVNVSSPVNKPYVYRKVLDNEYDFNLREIAINTDPNQAIDNQIVNVFGEQRYNYIRFDKGQFASLQRPGGHYLLPLSIPDRFYGFSIEYMIPKNGLVKGTGTNTEEANMNIFSLYNIQDTVSKPLLEIVGILLDDSHTIATVTTVNPHGYVQGDNIYFYGVSGIENMNNVMFAVQSDISATKFTIIGDFHGGPGAGGFIRSGKLDKFPGYTAMDHTYPLATTFPLRNETSDNSVALDSGGYTNPTNDANLLARIYPNSTYVDTSSYIITRLEGNDLVVRLRINSEIDGHYGERAAIFFDVFHDDGLNHSIRLILREEGIEVYIDYTYSGIAKWLDISQAGPYKAFEVPKAEIASLQLNSGPCSNYYLPIKVSDFISMPATYKTGTDKLRWWDLFVGLPNNVDMYIKKLNFFDNKAVNDYDTGDRINNEKNYTDEFYLFEVANPDMTITRQTQYQSFEVPAVFYKKFPDNMPEYYGYVLPQLQDQYNRLIIDKLGLTSKGIYPSTGPSMISNAKQDFFTLPDVFRNNAWRQDVHKSYDYNLFNGKVNSMYELYSSQVLTYDDLSSFLDLIEGKFKKIIEQFIPIVVNISEFGRLIKNSEFAQAKNRIPGNDKVCVGAYTNGSSFAYSRIFQADRNSSGLKPADFTFRITTNNVTLVPDTTVHYNTNNDTTMASVVTLINQAPLATGGNISADIRGGTLRVFIDYNWFMANYGASPNGAQLVFVQGNTESIAKFDYGNPTLAAHPDTLDACGNVVTKSYKDSDVCGSVTISLPKTVSSDVYIYHGSENINPLYVIHSTELGDNNVFIKNSTE